MFRRANAALLLLFAPLSLSAATFVVTSIADAEPGSLRHFLALSGQPKTGQQVVITEYSFRDRKAPIP